MDEDTDLFRDEIDELDAELFSVNSDAEVSISINASKSLEMYDQPIQYETKKRLYYIRFIEKRIDGGWTQKNIDPLLAQMTSYDNESKPKWRAIAAWYSKFRKSNFCITALIPSHGKKGNRSLKNSSGDFYFNKALEDKYLRKERPSIATTYRYYCDLIQVENSRLVSGEIIPISYTGFNARIKNLEPYDVDLARFGRSYVQKKYKLGDKFAEPTSVMERVEIDHTVLDFTVLMEDNQTVIGRPTITALVDCYSSCVVGFYVSFNEPSYLSIRAALINTMLSKDDVIDRFSSINTEWPCHGKIELLVVDNGVEFWGDSLESACKELGINTSYNPVGKPWKKPKVERFFRTLNTEFLDSLPGKNFRSVDAKGDYQPDKEAAISFSLFNELLHKWIIEVYNQKADDRKTRVPIAKWYEGMSVYPPIQYTGDDQEHLCVKLGILDTRSISKDGIQFLHLRYDSPELLEYRKYTPVASKRGLKADIKINPHDLSYIYVYLEQQECYLKVPAKDSGDYIIGLTLTQHKVNIKNRRKNVTDSQDSVSIAQSRLEIDQMVNQAWANKQKQKGMKKLAKYQGIDSNTAHSTVPVNTSQTLPSVKAPKNDNNSIDTFDWNSDDIEAF
ncbi:Mu transposase C-terminal domain-containing protein [Shewanella schlegeliana]|uniref:DDE-type integrase/transposase/recombinase n=1 Tax=Shewanella schlegeliana TaxID=190308 RepID=A0ABS1SX86_9GAMM|nr:Mu transposase C-terminal domain-containing protein [Shewanella schlegeliana]MBL4912605.1 DDE-type integrase/transposase/recombinase [Shewanella schlegeliana]MCL1109888.1 Mu transposase C-terminal domain-containing protein [Shewanella schlegeliana]GIU32585.1 transposase [Shewanella schlegeliana]